MKNNFYAALMACFVVVIIASILVFDNGISTQNQVKSKDGYVDLDKNFVDKNFESIQTSTGDDKTIEVAEAQKETDKNDNDKAKINDESSIKENKTEEIKQGFIWPLNGEVETDFSPDKIVYDNFLDQYTGEEEVSIKADRDDDVVASEKGKVLAIYDGVIGKSIEIEHENGYITTYSNVCELKVEESELVEKNEVLGKVNEIDGKYNFIKFGVKKDGKYIDPKRIVR